MSPVVRGGRAVITLVALLALASAQRQNGDQGRIGLDVAIVVLVVLVGLVNWLVTRWSFDGVTLRFETGLLRRDARQLPVARIQAVDVAQPLLARFFGLAELKITLAGGGRQTRLAYLSEPRANELRAALLAAHHGQHPATPEPAEVAGLVVPTGRLVASVVLSAPSFLLVLLVMGVVVVGLESRKGLAGALVVFLGYLFAMAAAVWNRFNVLYGFTVASAPDGIRIRRGLLGTVSETIPVRRIQAVRQIEPLLWRLLGWCRLEVDLARVPGREGGGGGSGQVRKTLLPVGSRALAETLRSLVIGSVAFEPTRPPRPALVKSPLSYHFLAAGHDGTIAVATTGRVCRRTCWVPLEKLQSIRRVQGPVQRRLGLATVHVDVAGRQVEAEFRDRAVAEADSLVGQLATLSRAARTRSAPEPRPMALVDGQRPDNDPLSSPVAPQSPAVPPPSSLPGPGWYPDPSGRHQHRYWDGGRWTEHVYDEGRTSVVDPL
jgi:putative membrane protein